MCLICVLQLSILSSQELVGDWVLHPNYTLSRNAKNYPGNKIEHPKSEFKIFKTLGSPIYFHEQSPTQRLTNFLDNKDIPRNSFSVELWFLDHVNMPVGALFCLRNPNQKDDIPWLFGRFEDEIIAEISTSTNKSYSITTQIENEWKKYWSHLVLTYDGSQLALYLNGTMIQKTEADGKLNLDETTLVELAGYFKNEPYMEISNLLKSARLYNGALDQSQIAQRFEALKELVEDGALFPDTLHFNAGPYLNYSTKESINILWETNYLTKATISYGTSLDLNQKVELDTPSLIHELTLEGLQPATTYYYQITAEGPNNERMNSGILTFGTADEDTQPFSFCIIGDTESRPHINHRLGELMWEERPNFIMHLGDITDGGKEPHKFEWNFEYFTGILPVSSRIPIFPVPGNGEGDLYWYLRYHRLPEQEAYYSFTYGNADFFMLNSNADQELNKGGKQYEWLKQKLAGSTAKWKFVAHHHCPVSSDENDFGNTWAGESSSSGDPKFDDIKKIYEEFNVDVVFFGHVHAYERTYPMTNGIIDEKNGVVYLKSGGGGGHLEDFTPTHNAFSAKIQRGNHYSKVDVFGDTFMLRMYDTEGRLKDFFELKK